MDRTPPEDDVLAALRIATRPLHDRIELLLALEGPMPPARYRVLIAGFHAFLQGWEAEIGAALPARLHGWFAERSRLPFAAADLAWFGEAPPPGSAASALPDGSLASLFGSMYVIEGSALGGQVITPRLARDMDLAPGRGASYFHGHGPRTGAMWREFRRRALEEIGTDPAAHAAACRAAVQTFAALIDTFEARLPAPGVPA